MRVGLSWLKRDLNFWLLCCWSRSSGIQYHQINVMAFWDVTSHNFIDGYWCSSEMLVPIYQSAQDHVTVICNVSAQSCENLQSLVACILHHLPCCNVHYSMVMTSTSSHWVHAKCIDRASQFMLALMHQETCCS